MASMTERIKLADIATRECHRAARDVRRFLKDCPEPARGHLRRQLTDALAELESARHTAHLAIRDIVATLGTGGEE